MGNKSSISPQVPAKWEASQIPSQNGKVAVVTGASSGIGYETALQLARKGAHVVLACRDESRGRQTEADLRKELAADSASGTVEYMRLDVSDLSSVRHFSEEFKKTHDQLDLLINNAGIMGGSYALSPDGYERQFATNHLGHFALTAQLLEILTKSAPSRVASVSSFVHRQAWLRFDATEVMAPNEKAYSQWSNYANTKLYNILFTKELNRRLRGKGIHGVTAVACHPGISSSNLFTAPSSDNRSWFWKIFFKVSTVIPHQSTQMGALPTLYAATGDNVAGGDFFGPGSLGTFFGHPRRETPSKLSQSTKAAWKLWEASEKLASVNFFFKE
ncbi:hypothetical protein PF008_g21081 [Phytophthora fragariae]|uniref:Short-chain dehydrogenase TIC 32 n=1 Tax=Phytophthora fragariae TaxID=53985 RepID=A0A6G0QXU3_9STRA|nr:hypothetical protein PF008_g21081 [Phytophthora fragariae]